MERMPMRTGQIVIHKSKRRKNLVRPWVLVTLRPRTFRAKSVFPSI
jgi:hypothetical protein